MPIINNILSDISSLTSKQKLQLVDKILISLNPTNKGVETIWNEEAEERITAYGQGRVPDADEQDVLKKYSK